MQHDLRPASDVLRHICGILTRASDAVSHSSFSVTWLRLASNAACDCAAKLQVARPPLWLRQTAMAPFAAPLLVEPVVLSLPLQLGAASAAGSPAPPLVMRPSEQPTASFMMPAPGSTTSDIAVFLTS